MTMIESLIKILLSILSIRFCIRPHQLNVYDQSNSQARRIEWNTLKVRWGPDPLAMNNETFVRRARTIQQAEQENYENLPNILGDSCVGQATVRHRYWKERDLNGIQMAFPQSAVDNQYYSFKYQTMFNREKINDIDMYTLTAYFVDSKTICTSGRTLSNLEHQGTGTSRFIRNGSNPVEDVFEIPQWEIDLEQTKWMRGACLKTMDVHYWYDNRIDTDCTRFLPVFLLYN